MTEIEQLHIASHESWEMAYDKDRLDWLEEHLLSMQSSRIASSVMMDGKDIGGQFTVNGKTCPPHRAATIRELIDNAMLKHLSRDNEVETESR